MKSEIPLQYTVQPAAYFSRMRMCMSMCITVFVFSPMCEYAFAYV